jgi:uncharacterized protein involved in exopolysaccharide biosynthesis
MLNRKPSPPDDLLAYHASRQFGDDPDFTLSEIWDAVRRRRLLIAALVAAGALAGLAVALLVPPKYGYTSSIDLGVVADDKVGVRFVEPPKTVLAKLNETYIPLATGEYLRAHPDVRDVPALTARLSSTSDLIVVESEGPASEEPVHRALHDAVVGLIAADHRQRTFRDLNPERQLSALKAQAVQLSAHLDRLQSTSTFLEQEAKQLRAGIDMALRNRSRSTSDRADGAGALAMLAATQEVQQLRDRLAGVQERLLVTIPSEREAVSKELAANQRAQDAQQTLVSARDKDTATGTRALSPPIRSLAPLGKGRLSIVALGAGAGGVLGLLLAILTGLPDTGRQPQTSPRG